MRLRRLAAAVRDADRLRGAVFRAAPDAIAISDADGRIREANAAAAALFGLPADKLAGRWMSDLVDAPPGTSRPACGNMLAALGRRARLDGIAADGSRFPVEITVQRVGTGRATRYAAFMRDLSHERRAARAADAQREHLAEIEKLSAMGALLSGVAHELNNPLAIVAAQAMLLRERAADADVARRAERIHAAALRAGRIVRSFTALATRRPAMREPLALADIFAEARELVGHRLRQAAVAVEADFPADLPAAVGDPDLVAQLFVSLLLNAQEALLGRDGARRIVVRAAVAPGGVSVEIADNGPGIAAAVANRLYEPYVTTKPAGGGLGIGLSLCRSVLDQHGGTIAHRSGRDGAAFTIVLPTAAAAPPAPPPGPTPRPAGLRILVVDDEVEVARALAELIEVFGGAADIVTSAAEAMARLAAEPWDAVFTDHHMPGLAGAALRDGIVARWPALRGRVVLVTGDTRARSDAAGTAGTPTLAKPFTAAAVRDLLARLARP